MKILIDTDWFSAIQDLQPSKQKEVLMAILNYPNGNSDTNLWNKTILPNLEKGQISYFNKLQNLKQNNPQKSNKKNPESVSESAIGSVSESAIGSASESGTDTTIREEKSRFNEDSIIYITGQYFDEFPRECMSLLRKYWTDDKIESIRKDLTSLPDHETTVRRLLEKYPPKPKTTRFVKPTVEEIETYCKERGNGINPMAFFNHYESVGWKVGKNPMKDWHAAIRTWESRNPKTKETPTVNFTELVALWNDMAKRLKLQPVSESDLMPERKAEIEKIVATKKPKDLKILVAQLEQVIQKSPKLLGRQDDIDADGHWFTKELGWQASFAFCFSTKGWSDIMAGKYNGESK